jgi:hypothetical protein
MQNLQTAIQERDQRERQFVSKIDELSTLVERQESQIRQRDAALDEVRGQVESVRYHYQSRLNETLEMLQKKDEALKSKQEDIKQKDFKIRLYEADYCAVRTKETPTNDRNTSRTSGGNHHQRQQQQQEGSARRPAATTKDDNKLRGGEKPKKAPKLMESKPLLRYVPEMVLSHSFPNVRNIAIDSLDGKRQRKSASPSCSSVSSSSSKKLLRKRIIPGETFGSPDSTRTEEGTPKKIQSKVARRTQRLSFLVPSYDSLAEAGSSAKEPIVMLESEED